MRRTRPFLLLAIAIALAMVSSSWVYRWLRAQQRVDAPVATVQERDTDVAMVTVARIDLPWGKHITEDMVTLVPFPVDYLPEGHFTETEALVGRIPRAEIRRNEPVLEHKLAALEASTGGVAAIMDPGKRAMAVRVDDEIGVAGFVKPGDRVDLYATLKDRGDEGEGAFTKLVLAHTLVLAIGTEMVRMGEEDEPRPVKVITLEVTPEEGEKLAFAAVQGKFRLALRHPLNTEPAYTRGADIASILSSYRRGGPDPNATKKSEYKVEVIRGGNVSSVTF